MKNFYLSIASKKTLAGISCLVLVFQTLAQVSAESLPAEQENAVPGDEIMETVVQEEDPSEVALDEPGDEGKTPEIIEEEIIGVEEVGGSGEVVENKEEVGTGEVILEDQEEVGTEEGVGSDEIIGEIGGTGEIVGSGDTIPEEVPETKVAAKEGIVEGKIAPCDVASCEPVDVDCDTQTMVPAVECKALVNLYNYTDGSNWNTNEGRLDFDAGVCRWYGVSCVPVKGGGPTTVASIDLPSNNLVGTIPSWDFKNFRDLQRIHFGRNTITSIPDTWSGLPDRLVELYLDSNRITYIPTTRDGLPSIKALTLNRNQIRNLPTNNDFFMKRDFDINSNCLGIDLLNDAQNRFLEDRFGDRRSQQKRCVLVENGNYRDQIVGRSTFADNIMLYESNYNRDVTK